ncbi:acyl-CoA N-acyltransferase [Melanogaster broomeanus]|nr:acyl-CoA N-acyltransferase [Melanogaster broomeanus]
MHATDLPFVASTLDYHQTHSQAKDLVNIITCNIHNLPENYPMRFWAYSSVMWPDVSFLAEDEDGKLVGFVLCSIELNEDAPRMQWVGHINSLSVLRPYRRMGLANKLMDLAHAMTRGHLQLEYIQLHVRKSNRAAHSLYTKLGYKYYHTEVGYYGDNEDAYSMRLRINATNPIRPLLASPFTFEVLCLMLTAIVTARRLIRKHGSKTYSVICPTSNDNSQHQPYLVCEGGTRSHDTTLHANTLPPSVESLRGSTREPPYSIQTKVYRTIYTCTVLTIITPETTCRIHNIVWSYYCFLNDM